MFNIYLSFFLVFLYIVIALIRTKHSVSFCGFFYMFALFFYSIAPFIQFLDHTPWPIAHDTTFLQVNYILLFSFFIYDFVYGFSFEKNNFAEEIPAEERNIRLLNRGAMILLAIALIFGFIIFYLANFSIINLFFRGGDADIQRVEMLQISALFISIFRIIFSLVVFSLTVFCLNRFLKVISIIFLLFFCAPTATARYFAAATYLPLIILFFPIFLRRRYLFNLMLSCGILVVFPLLDLFRYTEHQISWEPYEQFTRLHFDSYCSLAFVWENEFISWGRQMLGYPLFWVPRSVWPEKPFGSGYLVALQYDLFENGFCNVSMNFLGEGYINFGLFGIFFFVIIIALISKKMDVIFWEKYKGDIHNYFAIYYLYSLPMFFFVLRGDLLSGTAFTCGLLIVISICIWICKLYMVRKENETSTN